MSYGPHRTDRPWQQQEDETDHRDTNELIDTPRDHPDETDRLHNYVEELLSGPEPYENGPYTGDDNDDPGFYDDAPY